MALDRQELMERRFRGGSRVGVGVRPVLRVVLGVIREDLDGG